MKLYKIKIASNIETMFDFVKYCQKNSISIYITWTEEDLFEDILFLIVSVSNENILTFENKFSMAIVNMAAV